jgi:Flp pilus assembly protein TadD
VTNDNLQKLRNDVRQRPDDAEAWYELAAAALEQHELDEAREAMSQVLERAPDHLGANRALAAILGELGDGDGAIDCWRRVVALTGSDDLEAVTRLGIALSTAGQHDEATELLQEVALRRGSASSAHADLGMALLAAERLEEALIAFGRARDLDPRSAQAHCGLGLVYQHQGRWWEAADAFRQTEELAPDNPVGPMNLGMALATLGERNQARQALLRAAALAPGDAEIRQALAQLGAPLVEEDEVTRPASRGDELQASIQGNLETFKLLDVLEFLRVQNMTGALVVASKRGEGVVRISAGRISGASAPGVKALGPTLVEEGAIALEVLEAALAREGADRDEVLMSALWTGELIDRARLSATVRRRIMAALGEMLDWPEGAFSFHDGQSAEPAPISFNLHEITLQLAALRDRGQHSQR